jgi:signal transduction histidine kinase
MSMQARERNNISDDIAYWNKQVRVNRYMSIAASVLNLFLVVLAGMLISREIARRQSYASELTREVNLRTQELSALSQHLQQIREIEKADLARELHDELGGLLVAIKMDLSQIAKRLDTTRPEVGERLQRIQMALASGIELKRRVIEELRPTLLDNMGLFEALRWHAGQVCDQAGITLEILFPEKDPEISDAAAIAIFRVVQESLTNIAKHASARKVVMEVGEDGQEYRLTIEDDGVGLPLNHGSRAGTHGITGMKYRMLAIGGTFEIGPAGPRGVKTTLRFPRS